MNRLFVFSDLHGSLAAWLTIRALLSEEDGLAVAGDLFDTRYGRYGHPDFQPEQIRSDLKEFDHPFFYVYGNCDIPSFFPGYDNGQTFSAFGRRIFLHHGHRPVPEDLRADIVIRGHTHLCELEQRNGTLFMNPGSIALPRNNMPSYGIIDNSGARLVRLKTGKPWYRFPFSPLYEQSSPTLDTGLTGVIFSTRDRGPRRERLRCIRSCCLSLTYLE